MKASSATQRRCQPKPARARAGRSSKAHCPAAATEPRMSPKPLKAGLPKGPLLQRDGSAERDRQRQYEAREAAEHTAQPAIPFGLAIPPGQSAPEIVLADQDGDEQHQPGEERTEHVGGGIDVALGEEV